MKNIFVSYTNVNRDVSYSLVEFLEFNGFSCFIAPRDVDPGKPYAANLMKAIDECEAVLLIASAAINSSEHVLNEVDVIVERKKTLLPVFIEDFELNADYRYYLGRKQWVIAYPDHPKAYFPKILDALNTIIPRPILAKAPIPVQESTESGRTTVFEYIPERGIMINPEDHQRNVSFRTDTFINMMGGIFEKIADIAGHERAEEIFYDSGYVSGKSFAERINNQWDTGYSIENMLAKLNKWCKFDSSVGWGYFSSDVSIDEENDCLSGTVKISEAFIVDNMKKRKICSFIKGYCTGVVGTLLNSIEIEFICKECPLKSKFKSQCVFDIKSKG